MKGFAGGVFHQERFDVEGNNGNYSPSRQRLLVTKDITTPFTNTLRVEGIDYRPIARYRSSGIELYLPMRVCFAHHRQDKKSIGEDGKLYRNIRVSVLLQNNCRRIIFNRGSI